MNATRRRPGQPPKPCKEDGCDRPVRTRGWCSMHYGRVYVYGSVAAQDLPSSEENRFHKMTKWGEPSSHRPDLGPCLLYLGADNGNGYGQFRYNGHNGYAHRYAWEREHGPITDNLTIDHLCRVRCCVNVEHMELVDGVTNYLRGVATRTKCGKGHKYTPDNLYFNPDMPNVRYCKTCMDAQRQRSAERRTKRYQGLPDARLKYDVVLRDELATEVAERRMSIADAAEKLGCSPRYMDKMARRIRRGQWPAAKKSTGNRIPQKVRDALHERAGSLCEMCSKPANNAHHRRNLSQQGQNVLSNLLLLCGSGTTGCHGWVTEHPAMSYRNGWSIEGDVQQPGDVPVRRRGDLVLLSDDGSITPTEAI